MPQEHETVTSTAEITTKTAAEFKKLVLGLLERGQLLYKNDGSPDSKQASYLLPDGRTLRVLQLLDEEYDKGFEVIFSESNISQDGKPYTVDHYYSVYDYGGTSQYIHIYDEHARKRSEFVYPFPGMYHTDEEYQEKLLEQKELGLDQESNNRKWELEGIAQSAKVTSISELELSDLNKQITGLRNSGKLELLPPIPQISEEDDEDEEDDTTAVYPRIPGAIKLKDSEVYKNETEMLRRPTDEDIKKFEEFIENLIEHGEIIYQTDDGPYDWNRSKEQPYYLTEHFRLVDDRAAEVRSYFRPSYYVPKIFINISYEGISSSGEAFEISEEYSLDDTDELICYVVPHDSLRREREEFEEEQYTNGIPSAEEIEQADERRKELGLDDDGYERSELLRKLESDTGMHQVSSVELSKLIRQLKTAEPI